ncbi:MAG: heat-inducible transcriptional repressor HrcA [Micromonosporaceae bacterium]|nr:heat-inducible transcriptional repressor HrcA [Micromonosporaceae bacterium]
MGLDDRKLDVLRAIVEDYVATREPVGSKALVERHQLGVSPATVRNDMAVLEEEGYLRQPHTSAGRVPTDRGYRLFVDRLTRIKPLSPAERRAIERFLIGAVDLDDVVHRTVRLLAQLTRQVAVVQYPSLTRSAVRHLELVPISTTRLMVVMIADTGRVEQRQVDLPGPIVPDDVTDLRRQINEALVGRRLTETPPLVQALVEQVAPQLRPTMTTLSTVLLETLVERHDERIALAGTANLTRGSVLDFHGKLRPILEALEEEVVLLKLFGEVEPPSGQDQPGWSGGGDEPRLRIRIGDENEFEDLRSASVVSTGYGPGSTVVGGLGVLGPTRMDYPGTIATVRAVARYVGDLLAQN